MTERLPKVLSLGALVVILTVAFSPAREPVPLIPPAGQPPGPPAAQPAEGDGIEVLAKGPIHEAFATTAEAPTTAPVVKKQPPDAIEELPPDQKPAGDNVQWVPGYWHWDEDAERFIWVSGFWRQPPPGRAWVPGSWRTATSGWQWVGGFWQPVAPKAPAVQPNQIEYLSEPPATLEVGPTVAAPTTTSMYVPGAWVWRGRYVWRPGVWVEYRANWVWAPARYYWTPAGYVFVEGYWDYPIATRGVLFAPVVFVQPVYARPTYVYTPVYVVSEPAMMGALFVRRGHCHYYFGDYYEVTYVDRGYCAWCGTYTRAGFTVGFGTGRSWGYDPMWSYYSVAYRASPEWHRGMGELYTGRYRGELVRPPTTLVQQNTVINNITKVTNVTNVTNNITVVNGAPTVNNTNVSGVAMVAPLKVAPDIQRTKFEAVSVEARRNEVAAARQIRDVGVQRTKLETAVALQPAAQPVPGQPAQPRSIKLDVPKTSIVRAQMSDEKHAPPPTPHKPIATPPVVKLDHPHVDPKGVVVPPLGTPHVDPKGPLTTPPAVKMDQPHVDPKGPLVPPLGTPHVDPKGPLVPPPGTPTHPLSKIDPKFDPKSPRFDPKGPGMHPKVDPKRNPPPKGENPKGDPPRPPG